MRPNPDSYFFAENVSKYSLRHLQTDFSIRNNKTIVREIKEDINLITMGQSVLSLKASTDYVVNDRLNVRFFIDKVVTNPYVSNTFPGGTTNIGISVRFTLAQ